MSSETSVFWCGLWKEAGRPKQGELFKIKNSCSLKYKYAIKQAFRQFEHSSDGILYEHFISKKPTEFWKSWNRKFNSSLASNCAHQINGIRDSQGIANTFADSFNKIYLDSSTDSIVIQSFFLYIHYWPEECY